MSLRCAGWIRAGTRTAQAEDGTVKPGGPDDNLVSRMQHAARSGETFARRVFSGAGIYGVIVLLPMYFMEAAIGRDYPPPITHPEHFYGFVGVALTWQIVFLLIARDVRRYRLMMLPSILEKLTFGIPAWVLYATGRAPGSIAAAGSIDLLLGLLFVLAFLRTRQEG